MCVCLFIFVLRLCGFRIVYVKRVWGRCDADTIKEGNGKKERKGCGANGDAKNDDVYKKVRTFG